MDLALAEWRLIEDGPASGAWNMAVDEAILEAAGSGEVPPTLRLYAWNPACLSLGYAQHSSEIDRAALEENDWEIVRRPTGGRAILHTDELTYAVMGPVREPRLQGGILESYRRLSTALLSALRQLGMQASADDQYLLPPGASRGGPVCFEVPSNYEITVEGKKLIGSAQARRKGGVLQHGSLPLYGDLTRITRVLLYSDVSRREEAARRLLSHATTVELALGRAVSWSEAARAFQTGFCEALSLEFTPGNLTPAEFERAQHLVAEKYSHGDWTDRV